MINFFSDSRQRQFRPSPFDSFWLSQHLSDLRREAHSMAKLDCRYPVCRNLSDTSSWIFLRPKGSIGHVFTLCIRTQDPNQLSNMIKSSYCPTPTGMRVGGTRALAHSIAQTSLGKSCFCWWKSVLQDVWQQPNAVEEIGLAAQLLLDHSVFIDGQTNSITSVIILHKFTIRISSCLFIYDLWSLIIVYCFRM